MSWLHDDLTKPIVAPLQSDASNRNPIRAALVVGQFCPEFAPRYQRRDIDGVPCTFCNFFLADVSAAMGAPVPQMLANKQIEWLQSPAARERGWAEVSEHAAQGCSDEGMLVVVGWFNRNGGPGHVAVCVPSLDSGPVLIAQAGATNFLGKPVKSGFGALPVTYFVHP